MAEPFLGEIRMFGFNFPPRGWAGCDGQLLPISNNSALFSLYGTIYGGDGRTTFGLPDLRGRTALNMGTGPGLTHRAIGSRGGVEYETLSTSQIPAHSHTARLHSEDKQGTSGNGNNKMLANSSPAGPIYTQFDAANNKTLDSNAITVENTGGGQPFNVMQPFLTINICCALQGVFPSRS